MFVTFTEIDFFLKKTHSRTTRPHTIDDRLIPLFTLCFFFRFFTDGVVDQNIVLLWAPGQPPAAGGDFGCVAARLAAEAGSNVAGGGNTWSGPTDLSLTTSSCTVAPDPSLNIRGIMCLGPLPVYAGAV